jgi:hypothetical protein
MKYHYVWLSAFLVPWIALYAVARRHRREMLNLSLATSLLGLSEPIFVPEYWNPPSLFDLAQRTGFDIESFIFCFAIGGIGAVFYNAVMRRDVRPLSRGERQSTRHRLHRLALLAPYLVFPPLYLLAWNPIYAGIAALAAGGVASALCRPDLLRNTLVGGTLFVGFYGVFMLLLVAFAPGYIEAVWNLPALSGILIGGVPLEELAFGFAFGLYWGGVYEHFCWRRSVAPAASVRHASLGGHHG